MKTVDKTLTAKILAVWHGSLGSWRRGSHSDDDDGEDTVARGESASLGVHLYTLMSCLRVRAMSLVLIPPLAKDFKWNNPMDAAVNTMLHLYFSNYVNSPWCVEEFLLAHQKVVTKQKNYLIPVLMEDLNPDELSKHPELETYIRTHTYIDARAIQQEETAYQQQQISTVRKRIR